MPDNPLRSSQKLINTFSQQMPTYEKLKKISLKLLTGIQQYNGDIKTIKKKINTLQSLLVIANVSLLVQIYSQIIQFLSKLIQNQQIWNRYKIVVGHDVNQIIKVFYKKIQQFKTYKKIFPRWQSFKLKYSKVTKTQLIKIDDQTMKQKAKKFITLNEKFSNLIKQFNQQNQICLQYEDKYLYIQEPICISSKGPQLMSQIVARQFSKFDGYKFFFHILQRELQLKNKSAKQQKAFIANIYQQKHISINNLCCTTAFYDQQKLIFDGDISQDFQIISSAKKIEEGLLKQTVTSFLNSKGGIILFDIKKHLTNYIVLGAEMTQFQKQKIQNKIMSLLQSISPAITPKKHYQFSYIPVLQNYFNKNQTHQEKSVTKNSPKQRKMTSSESSLSNSRNSQMLQRKFKKGYYVLRIRVQSPESNITYHISCNTQNYFYQRKNFRNYELKGQQIYQFMKAKYLSGVQQQILDIRNHNHPYLPIVAPQRGHVIYGEQFGKIDKMQMRYNFQQKSMQKGKQYRHLSLIIVDQKNLNKVQNVMMKQKIHFQIRQAFPQNQFKLSLSTFMVYHDIKFDKLKGYVDPYNLTYCNNSKKVKLLSTTMNLQTVFIDQNSIQNLIGWFKIKFPHQNLKYEIRGRQTVLTTQSYLSAVYMYMLLDQFGIKAKFIRVGNLSQKIPSLQNAYMN